MLKKQETLHSSSTRREIHPVETNHAKAIGCMSGFVKLFSKYQQRRKFLTFGRKQEKHVVYCTNPEQSVGIMKASPTTEEHNDNKRDSILDMRRFSCDVPRSPSLSQEIRRSKSVINSTKNLRTPPVLVARLMGLQENPAVRSPEVESAAERRRKLLGALEKVDEDLKTLKKIIEVVQSAEGVRNPVPEVESWATKKCTAKTEKLRSCCKGGGDDVTKAKMCTSYKYSENPSPVSVLDEFARSVPFSSSSGRHATTGQMPQQQTKPRRKKAREYGIIDQCFFNKICSTELFQAKYCESTVASPFWSNKSTMTSSVDEVCRDISWGEKREVEKIGLTLQDHIWRGLVEEIVMELRYCCMYSLPFEACKRRLIF